MHYIEQYCMHMLKCVQQCDWTTTQLSLTYTHTHIYTSIGGKASFTQAVLYSTTSFEPVTFAHCTLISFYWPSMGRLRLHVARVPPPPPDQIDICLYTHSGTSQLRPLPGLVWSGFNCEVVLFVKFPTAFTLLSQVLVAIILHHSRQAF